MDVSEASTLGASPPTLSGLGRSSPNSLIPGKNIPESPVCSQSKLGIPRLLGSDPSLSLPLFCALPLPVPTPYHPLPNGPPAVPPAGLNLSAALSRAAPRPALSGPGGGHDPGLPGPSPRGTRPRPPPGQGEAGRGRRQRRSRPAAAPAPLLPSPPACAPPAARPAPPAPLSPPALRARSASAAQTFLRARIPGGRPRHGRRAAGGLTRRPLRPRLPWRPARPPPHLRPRSRGTRAAPRAGRSPAPARPASAAPSAGCGASGARRRRRGPRAPNRPPPGPRRRRTRPRGPRAKAEVRRSAPGLSAGGRRGCGRGGSAGGPRAACWRGVIPRNWCWGAKRPGLSPSTSTLRCLPHFPDPVLPRSEGKGPPAGPGISWQSRKCWQPDSRAVRRFPLPQAHPGSALC